MSHARLYGTYEIYLPNGKLPPGVTLEDIQEKATTAIWGSVAPVLGLDASKKDSMPCELHVHVSTYDKSCKFCRNHADDERY